jgi:hypothetical protein
VIRLMEEIQQLKMTKVRKASKSLVEV